MRKVITVIACLAGISTFYPSTAYAGDKVYQYTDPQGRAIFSDRKKHDAKLVKTRYYGRPSAKVSCVGDDSTKMGARISTYRPFINKYAAQYSI